LKMTLYILSRDVNWLGALEQKGTKHMGIKQGLGVYIYSK